jgi:hypothetical protein
MRKALFIFWLFLTIVSCKNEGRKNLIPRGKFKDVMVDIYMADGYYMLKYNDLPKQNDTSNYYNDVLKQYGYTRANFDSTLKYYSSRIKELDEIYDDVLTELNKRQQEAYLLQQYDTDSTRNLYKKKKIWSLPKDGPREMIPFKVAIKDTGLYTIVVQLRVYNDDHAKNLRLTSFFWSKDGTKSGRREYFPTITYKKTRRLVVLSTSKHISGKKKATHIQGWILNHDNTDTRFKKHVEVKSIIIVKN